MAGLTGLFPGNTYGDLLYLNNSNAGITGSLQTVYDGLGNATGFKVSSTSVGFGNLTFSANAISTSSGNLTISSTGGTTTLSDTTFTITNQSAFRTGLGLGTIATQAANNVTITGGSVTGITDITVADGGTGASTASGARTSLGVVPGTDVQIHSNKLTALDSLTWAANKLPYFTGASTVSTSDISAFALTFLDDADASAVRTTIGAGTGNGTVTNVATAGLATGGAITNTGTITVTAATQADMETGTSTTTAVVPGRQKHHIAHPKAWVFVLNSGTPSIDSSSGVTSLTDNGVGDVSVTWSTATTNGNGYATVGTVLATTGYAAINPVSTTVSQVLTFNNSLVAADRAFVVYAMGDQA